MTFVNVATLIPDGQAQVPTTMKISTTTSTSLSSWTSVMPVHASAAKLAARQDDDADGYDNEIEVLPKTWIPVSTYPRLAQYISNTKLSRSSADHSWPARLRVA